MLEVKDYQLGTKKPEKQNWQPTDEEREILKEFDDDLIKAQEYRRPFEDKWNENIERYKAEAFVYDNGKAGIVLPIAKWMNEQKQAVESKSPPEFAFSPLQYEEDEAIARILEEIVRKHVWNLELVDLNYKLDQANHAKGIVGGALLGVGWRKIYRTIRETVDDKNTDAQDEKTVDKEIVGDVIEPKKPKLEEKQVLFYDDIFVDLIPIEDYWLHPLATCVADSPYIYIRYRFDYATFLETFSDTNVFKNIQYIKPGKWDFGPTNDNTKDRYGNLINGLGEDGVVVFARWNKMKDQLVIKANGVIICDRENPYDHKELPFADIIDILQYGTYIGEALTQRVSGIVDTINSFLNVAIDKEKISVSGLNLMDENGSDFDDVAMLLSPNYIYRVADPQKAFNHIEIPGMGGSTVNMMNMLMDYLVYATGVDFRQITDLNGDTKATVAAIRREITQGRLALNVRRNENRGIKRLAWLLVKTVQQYYPLPLVEKLAGQEEGDIYRRIRIPDVRFEEKPNAAGEFTPQSLRQVDSGEGLNGFFQARPSYIRSKGDIGVRVVPDTSFSASQELEKNKAKDALATAQSAVELDPQTGQPKPLLSVRYFAEKYVRSMNYDVQKAFDTENKDTESTAKDEAAKLMGQQPQPQPSQTMQNGVPPDQPPAMLTGRNSEPVQQLQQDLGQANTATNGP